MYVSDRDMDARCDIYVGVIVWSVKVFLFYFFNSKGFSLSHSTTSRGVTEVSPSVNFNVGKACAVPCFKCEAKDDFDWILISWSRGAAREAVFVLLLLCSTQRHGDLPLREWQLWTSGTHTWPTVCAFCQLLKH